MKEKVGKFYKIKNKKIERKCSKKKINYDKELNVQIKVVTLAIHLIRKRNKEFQKIEHHYIISLIISIFFPFVFPLANFKFILYKYSVTIKKIVLVPLGF